MRGTSRKGASKVTPSASSFLQNASSPFHLETDVIERAAFSRGLRLVRFAETEVDARARW